MGNVKISAKLKMQGKLRYIFCAFAFSVALVFILGDMGYLLSALFQNTFEFLPMVVSFCLAVITLVFYPPIKMGTEYYFFLSSKNKSATAHTVFSFFSKKELWYCFKVVWGETVLILSRLVFFMFPSVSLFIVLTMAFSEGRISYWVFIILIVGEMVFTLMGLSFFFVSSADSVFYYPVIFTNPHCKIKSAQNKCAELTKNRKKEINLFRLSFFPWNLLCFLVVPTFYVWGYYKHSLTELATHSFVMKNNKSQHSN